MRVVCDCVAMCGCCDDGCEFVQMKSSIVVSGAALPVASFSVLQASQMSLDASAPVTAEANTDSTCLVVVCYAVS